MKRFYYCLKFSPHINFVTAKNKSDAWLKIVALWGNKYNCNEVVYWLG